MYLWSTSLDFLAPHKVLEPSNHIFWTWHCNITCSQSLLLYFPFGKKCMSNNVHYIHTERKVQEWLEIVFARNHIIVEYKIFLVQILLLNGEVLVWVLLSKVKRSQCHIPDSVYTIWKETLEAQSPDICFRNKNLWNCTCDMKVWHWKTYLYSY